ncbi:hypothetical protein ANO14919_048080 [Xylariales sp. No.14919]|nr:hypothetical protein ANO14919_048080 [Xylariales sp. No.14919]
MPHHGTGTQAEGAMFAVLVVDQWCHLQLSQTIAAWQTFPILPFTQPPPSWQTEQPARRRNLLCDIPFQIVLCSDIFIALKGAETRHEERYSKWAVCSTLGCREGGLLGR